MLRKLFPIVVGTLFLLLYAADALAGGPPMGPPMGPPPCWPPPCAVPIDGGISFLIAAGVALGGKKFYDSRKKSA